ncbi:hypothetical protein FVW27_11800, partial [Desulfovibrio sp. XJ01]|nr:hypothetical protein [Nitratidesulfovibrio liaohensis]
LPGEALQAARPGAVEPAGAERQRQELELFAERLKALLLLPAVDLLDRARVLSCLTVAEHRLRRLRAECEAVALTPAL